MKSSGTGIEGISQKRLRQNTQSFVLAKKQYCLVDLQYHVCFYPRHLPEIRRHILTILLLICTALEIYVDQDISSLFCRKGVTHKTRMLQEKEKDGSFMYLTYALGS